jgi:hypothetical protein
LRGGDGGGEGERGEEDGTQIHARRIAGAY